MTQNLITNNYNEWVLHIESLYNHQELYEYGDLKYIFHPNWTEKFAGFMKHPISVDPKTGFVAVSEIVYVDSLDEVSKYFGNYLYMVTERKDKKIVIRYAKKGLD